MQSAEEKLAEARSLLIQRQAIAESLADIDRKLAHLLDVCPTETRKPKKRTLTNDQFLALAMGGIKHERLTAS